MLDFLDFLFLGFFPAYAAIPTLPEPLPMATLRDDLNALTTSDATLATATEAAAQASTTLAAAQTDRAAKARTFSADLAAQPGGKAVDTADPNPDGTLTEYIADTSVQGWHTNAVATIDSPLAPPVATVPPPPPADVPPATT